MSAFKTSAPKHQRVQRWFYQSHLRTTRLRQVFQYRFTPAGQLWTLTLALSFLPALNTKTTLTYQLVSLLASALFVSALSSWFTRLHPCQLQRHHASIGMVDSPVEVEYHVEDSTDINLEFVDQPEVITPSFERWHQAIPKDRSNAFDRFTGYRRFQKLLMARYVKPELIEIPSKRQPPSRSHHDVTLNAHLIFPSRGSYTFKGLRFFRKDPLGLMRCSQFEHLTSQILILPKPVTLPAFSLRGKGQQQHQPEQSSYHQGQSGEFASLRDYQSGDSLKSIHWKSSAKTGELKVIEVQEEISTSIALVFDTQIQDEVDFETALRVACSLCQNLSNQHQSIELLFVDENVHHVRCGRGAHPSIDGLKALALAEGQVHNSSNVLKNSITEQLHQLSSVLLVTSLWQTEQRELTQWCEDRGCPVAVCCICEEPPLESARPQSQQWIQVHPSRLDDDLSQLRAWTT